MRYRRAWLRHGPDFPPAELVADKLAAGDLVVMKRGELYKLKSARVNQDGRYLLTFEGFEGEFPYDIFGKPVGPDGREGHVIEAVFKPYRGFPMPIGPEIRSTDVGAVGDTLACVFGGLFLAALFVLFLWWISPKPGFPFH